MNWRTVVILSCGNKYGRSLKYSFIREAEERNIEILGDYVLNLRTNTSVEAVMKSIRKSGTRVIISLAKHADLHELAKPVAEAGLLGKEWVWVGGEATAMPLINREHPTNATSDLWNGLLLVTTDSDDRKNLTVMDKLSNLIPEYHDLYLTCLQSLAHGFRNVLSDRKTMGGPMVPRKLKGFLQNFTSDSAGTVHFDGNGDRASQKFVVHNAYNGSITRAFLRSASGDWSKIGPVRFYDGTSNVPEGHPPFSVIHYGQPEACVLLTFTVISIAVVLGTFARLFKYRKYPLIQEVGISTLFLVSLGIVLMLLASVMEIGHRTYLICNIRLWLWPIGLQMITLPILYFAFHAWLSFENPILRELYRRHTLQQRLPWIAAGLLIPLVLTFWTLTSPAEPAVFRDADMSYRVCTSANKGIQTYGRVLTYGWNSIIIVALVLFAFLIRDLRDYSETPRYCLYFILNLVFSRVAMLPLAAVFKDFHMAQHWINFVVVTYACLVTWGCIHLRLLYCVRRDSEDETMDLFAPPLPVTLRGLQPVSGRPCSSTADFPVLYKRGAPLRSWEVHRLLISHAEGYFGLIRPSDNVGLTLNLKSLRALPCRRFRFAVELVVDGHKFCIIQTPDNKQRDLLIEVLTAKA